MRLFAFLAFVSIAAAQAPAEAPKQARVEGSVVSATGEPVPRAQIRLQGQTSIQNGQVAPPTAYSATAGDDGKFVIENIDPGRNYTLTVQRPGFLPARYGARSTTAPGAPISLDAGQTLKGISISMTPQAVVSGRVTDQAGDPVQNAAVILLRRGYQKGVRQFVPANTGQSNDQGEFRIANVPPGRYILSATDRLGGIAASAASQTIHVTSYYPSSIDQQGAAAIDVTPGSDVRGIDIRLRQARVYSVRGKVLDAAGAPAANIIGVALPQNLQAASALEMSLIVNGTRLQSRQDGSFELRGLRPGAYTILTQPTPPAAGPSRGFARQNISVADADLDGVVLQLAPGASIQGSLRLEGGDIKTLLPAVNPANAAQATALTLSASNAGVPISGARVAIGLVDGSGIGIGNVTGTLKDDGTFTLDAILPSKFFLNVAGLPPGHYVKSARFGGADATTQQIDATSGSGGNLEIVVSNKAADVNGVVTPEKDEPVTGAMVTLWSKDPDPGAQNNGVRTAYADQSGGFQFQGLRPGVYYVAAWEDVDNGLAQARDFLDQFTGEAARLELGEGAHAAAQAKLIRADKIKTAEEKLP